MRSPSQNVSFADGERNIENANMGASHLHINVIIMSNSLVPIIFYDASLGYTLYDLPVRDHLVNPQESQ